MLDQLIAPTAEKDEMSTDSESRDEKGKDTTTIIDKVGKMIEATSRKIGGGLTLYYGRCFYPYRTHRSFPWYWATPSYR